MKIPLTVIGVEYTIRTRTMKNEQTNYNLAIHCEDKDGVVLTGTIMKEKSNKREILIRGRELILNYLDSINKEPNF